MKNAKKRTTQGKPITDFFAPASKPHPQPSKSRVSPSVPSQASSSQDIKVAGASETTGMPLNKSKVASIVSKSQIGSSSKGHGLEFFDGLENSSSTKTSLSKPLFASSGISLKRVRSPDFQAYTKPSTSLNKKLISDNLKTSDRRRGKFDSDSDMDTPNTVVYVNSTVYHSSILQ